MININHIIIINNNHIIIINNEICDFYTVIRQRFIFYDYFPQKQAVAIINAVHKN